MRITGPKCRLCRREGKKLFLKGARCETQKCAFTRHSDVPGKYGKLSRAKKTEYNTQLRTKQAAKRIYGLSEKQFYAYYEVASQLAGNTSENFVQLLEGRLDNAVFRAGLAPSRAAARQIVSHGLLRKNGRRVTVPSMQVKIGDKFTASERAIKSPLFEGFAKKKSTAPEWIKADFSKISLEIAGAPVATDAENIDAQTIVEFYSR
jgi:small subunit ribosomal protein S4